MHELKGMNKIDMSTDLSAKTLDRIRHRAASLLEVVATIASLAALSTLLLPVMAGARGQSKATQCLANLSRLGAASAIYAAADPNEFSIPVHALLGASHGALGDYEWGGKSGIGEPEAGTNGLFSRWGTALGRGPASRPLNRILYRDVFPDYTDDPGPDYSNWRRDTTLQLNAFRCPPDSGYTGHHYTSWRDSKLSSFDHYGNSYSPVLSWIGTAGPNCRLESNSAFLKPVSRIPNPHQTLLFIENCGRFGYRINYGNEDDGGCGSLSGILGSETDGRIYGWHGRAWVFQATFADGHAGNILMRGHRQPEPFLGRYPLWRGSPTEHNFWRCVIIRGPGWQTDTLPASPVRTELRCATSGGVIEPIG